MILAHVIAWVDRPVNRIYGQLPYYASSKSISLILQIVLLKLLVSKNVKINNLKVSMLLSTHPNKTIYYYAEIISK
jgi:hypothetical protein